MGAIRGPKGVLMQAPTDGLPVTGHLSVLPVDLQKSRLQSQRCMHTVFLAFVSETSESLVINRKDVCPIELKLDALTASR